jgi:hypothetical protein
MEKEKQDKEWEQKREEMRKKDEEKLSKNQKRRQKMKDRKKKDGAGEDSKMEVDDNKEKVVKNGVSTKEKSKEETIQKPMEGGEVKAVEEAGIVIHDED